MQAGLPAERQALAAAGVERQRAFDRLNRWLYAPRSPLNWFTKRRTLQITPRIPSRSPRGERLWNGAGLGQVHLDAQGRPRTIRQLNADGSEPTRFESDERAAD